MTLAAPVWSKSQAGAYKECVRKHALSQWNPEPPFDTDPRWPSVQRLKKISNRFLWAGSLVHETVGDTLKTLRQGQPPESLNTVLSTLKERMRTEFQSSKAGPDGPLRLFEHEYKETLNKEKWAALWGTVETSITRFFKSSWMARFQTLPPESWKAVDEVVSFQADAVKTYVKLDCAVDVEGQISLIDWTTSPLKTTDRDRLDIAALYAHEVWGADPAQIAGWVVSLADGRTLRVNFDEDRLMEAHLKISEEAGQLSAGRDAKDPFSHPLPSYNGACGRCHFKQICHPGGPK